MSSAWRRPCVGLSSGLFQSPSYLLPQFVAAIGASVGAPGVQLAWLTPLGLLLPVVVGLLVAAGDWFGGRALILALAALTSLGVGLIAAAGLAAAHHARATALVLVILGACLVPAAVRHGALVVAHETQGLAAEEQLSESRALRRFLVLGIYLVPLPAGLLAARHGWEWVFASLALAQLVALAVLAGVVKSGPRGPRPSLPNFGRDLVGSFREARLAWAAAGAFAAQATVFAFVGGLPVLLAARGHSAGVIGAVVFAAVLAALFVGRPRARDSRRFGRWAGGAPVAGLVGVAAAAPLDGLGPTAGVAGLAAFAVAGVLIELSKQWSQVIALLQARAGGPSEHDYRRQAVVNLGANLGTVAGAGLGPWSAAAGQPAWLVVLLGAASTAWVLQATWFATPRGAGRHRRPPAGRHRA